MILMVVRMRLEYYINIMMEKIDWGNLKLTMLGMEEIASKCDIDES